MSKINQPDINQQKQVLRLELNTARKALSLGQRQQYSEQIQQRLQNHLQAVLDASLPTQLLIYCALPFEVDTHGLFGSDVFEVYVPRMLEDVAMEWVQVDASAAWEKASFGIVEPSHGKLWVAHAHQQTVMVCPLLGFDRMGHRLGMGKGYFDRWLALHGKHIDHLVGLAFSCQELPKVPTDSHDAPLSTIITEREVIACPIP